jgi:hypothetical protein
MIGIVPRLLRCLGHKSERTKRKDKKYELSRFEINKATNRTMRRFSNVSLISRLVRFRPGFVDLVLAKRCCRYGPFMDLALSERLDCFFRVNNAQYILFKSRLVPVLLFFFLPLREATSSCC